MHLSLLILAAAVVIAARTDASATDRPFIFGVNPIMGVEAGRDVKIHDPQMYKAIAEAGGTIVRIGLNWDQIERVKGKPEWDYWDEQIELAVDNNLAIVGLINSTPSWASPTGKDTPFYAPKDEAKAHYERFLRDLVARYKGRIKYWEFWNEANGFGWHTDKGYNIAEEYVPWLKITYKTLKEADPTCLVGLTGLDDAAGNAPIYLRKVYDLGGKGFFDAVVDHPYTDDGAWNPAKLHALRAIMQENGDGQLPIWITEMGWNTAGREEDVARWLTDYLRQLSQPALDFVPIATYHTICDFSLPYGLMTKALEPRPGYEAFKAFAKPARPMASNIQAEAIDGGALITFNTPIPCTARVLYGPTRNYGQLSEQTALGTSHRVKIGGLESGEICHFRVRPATGAYNFSFSGDFELTAR